MLLARAAAIVKPDPEVLRGFEHAQALAYRCVHSVAQKLERGMTERDASRFMAEQLRGQGVRHLFHKPFAWFGDRTAFRGFSKGGWFPSGRRLEDGMPVILDVAPIVEGYCADVGYSFAYGDNRQMQELQAVLAQCRQHILSAVRARPSLRTIYREIDGLIADHGYRNLHCRYPYGVLGHRVERFRPGWLRNRFQSLYWMGYGVPQYFRLVAQNALARRWPRFGTSPLWNDSAQADHPPTPGLWAVEPHIATADRSVGAKFEEILVIGEDDAYWLD